MDLNDLRKKRKEAAAALNEKAAAYATLLEAEAPTEAEALAAHDAKIAEAEAEHDAAKAAFDKADKAFGVAEQAEQATIRSATGGDAPSGARATVPAAAGGGDDAGLVFGMAVHALANAGGNMMGAVASLEADGLNQPAALLQGSQQSAGGVTIRREQSSEIIKALKPRTTVRKHAEPVSVPAGEMRKARQSGGATVGYGAEVATIGATSVSFDAVDTTYKKLTGLLPISNSLLRHSTADMASFARGELFDAMALGEDLAFLRGPGGVEPRGLKNWCLVDHWQATPVGTVFNDVDLFLRRIVGKLTDSNVPLETAAWFMRGSAKTFLAGLKDNDGRVAYPSIDANGTLFGFPIETTSQLPGNLGVGGDETEIILAAMGHVMIGDTQSISLAVSDSASYVDANGDIQSAFATDKTLIRAIAEHDIAPKHDQAIAGGLAAGWVI